VRFAILAVVGLSPLIWLSVRAEAHQTLKAQPSLRVLHATDHHRRATWHCQSHLGRPHTRTAYSDKRSSSVRYRVWVRNLWRTRADSACDKVRMRQVAYGSWLAAVSLVETYFPGSRSWLLSCSASEGGWGRWVPNIQGSGAGGNLQFMSGTFYAYVGVAFADARRRGLHLQPEARSWYSPLGQAVTGAYMLSRGLKSHWVGHGCA